MLLLVGETFVIFFTLKPFHIHPLYNFTHEEEFWVY